MANTQSAVYSIPLLMHMHCLLILPPMFLFAFLSIFQLLLPCPLTHPLTLTDSLTHSLTLSKSLCALQGHTRPNCERHRHILVRHIGLETIRHGILHGPSTAADCLSVCDALWRICVDYHLLGRSKATVYSCVCVRVAVCQLLSVCVYCNIVAWF